MKKITLGRTNAEVSTISLGTWSYGGTRSTSSMAVGWEGQEDKDSKAALLKAWESGITHWDTADVYGDGHSEAVIGTMWNDVSRKDIFLATKVGWDQGPHKYWYNPDHMRTNVERSLQNLGTDCVDLLYLHHCNFGNQDETFDSALETVRRFQEEGKTKFVGLSDWDSDKIMKFIDRADPDVVQPYRNVMDDVHKSSGLKAYVEDNNLGACFFSPIKHGLLTGKYRTPPKFEAGDFRSSVKDFQNAAIIEKMKENRETLKEKFFDHQHPTMHGLVDALLTDSPTGCVLLGQRNVAQVEIASTLGNLLSDKDCDWVKSLYAHPEP